MIRDNSPSPNSKHPVPSSQSCPCEGSQSSQQRPCTCEPQVAESHSRSGLSSPQGSRTVSPATHGYAAPAGEYEVDDVDNPAAWSLGPCILGRPQTKIELQERWMRKLDRLVGDDDPKGVLFNMHVATTLTYKGETKTRFMRHRECSYAQVGNTVLRNPETIADFYRVESPTTTEAIDRFGTAD